MRINHGDNSLRFRSVGALALLALLAACATQPPAGQSPDAVAEWDLRQARSPQFSAEDRAGYYLDAAALTATRLGSETAATPARQTYNAAVRELTMLLRSTDGGRMWKNPLTITGKTTTYRLELQPPAPAIWSPDYFGSFEDPGKIKARLIKPDQQNIQNGVGGTLVGVRAMVPRETFAPVKGIAAPVTSTIDFNGSNAVLALRRPDEETKAKVEGAVRPLAGDFSAPISYYQPPANLLLKGFLAGVRGGNYMDKTGLYFLQPYDPDKIPLIFVHGLFSTPFTWVHTINGLQADPEVRKHYQFWVFSYPTGNPILYSALRLREELDKVDKLYPNHRPYVLVGHSMGGILSHAQVITLTRGMWEKEVGKTAKNVFARNSSNSLVVRTMIFQANPRVKRVVFVCAPHRGSKVATGGIGNFGMSLISLPGNIASSITDSLTGAELAQLTGSSKRLPNSISGLKPTNPAFKVVNSAPISVPYHSIIGDRGKGNSPNSTDGVVPYWSSHFDGAKSERIVPGPHSSCELPETIKELDRILELNLKTSAN